MGTQQRGCRNQRLDQPACVHSRFAGATARYDDDRRLARAERGLLGYLQRCCLWPPDGPSPAAAGGSRSPVVPHANPAPEQGPPHRSGRALGDPADGQGQGGGWAGAGF